MQFQNPRRSDPGVFQSSKFGERCGQLHMGDAVCRVCLNGPISRMSSFLITAPVEITHCLCVKRGPSPGIERAETHTLLTPFYRAFSLPTPSKDDAS